jgi:two-component sensor histidine kinase
MSNKQKNARLLLTILLLNCLWQGEVAGATAFMEEASPDTTRVHSLLTEARSKIFKPGERHTDLDSAIVLANQAEGLSKQFGYEAGIAQSYVLIAMAYREKGEREKGKHYAERAVTYCKERTLLDAYGESLVELSQYYDFNEGFTQKLQITRQAIEAYRQSGNIKEQAFCLKNLGDFLTFTDSIGQSISVLKKSASLYESINDSGYRGAYDLLGTLYREIGDFDLALKYGLLAEKAAIQAQDTSLQLCTILNRIGATYHYSKDFKQAAHYFSKAFDVAARYDDLITLYNVHANLMNAYLGLGKEREALLLTNQFTKKYPPTDDIVVQIFLNRTYLNIYRALKDKVNGQKYCDRVLSLSEDKSMVIYNMISYSCVIDFLLQTKQYDRAEASLKKYDVVIQDNPYLKYSAINALQWFKLDSARGNYLSAINYHTRYKNMEDSLYSLNKAQLVEALKLEFETEKKDHDIQLLKQQGDLQEAKLDQSHFARNISFGGVAVLLLIAGLLYYLYHTKQKSNHLLTHLLTEKEWLLKEIHHRVKNNLQTVLSLLESQSRQLSNEAFDALQESQNRVYAMSLIHKKLYQSVDVSSINMEDYLRDLVQHLRDSFGSSGNIRFSLQLDHIELDVSQAVPIGLIVNEAITNSIKYAFPDRQHDNEVNISIKKVDTNKVILFISDNGIGISTLKENTQSLGLKLMRGLTEDIEGTFSIETNHGVTIMIEFIANMPFQMVAVASHIRVMQTA